MFSCPNLLSTFLPFSSISLHMSDSFCFNKFFNLIRFHLFWLKVFHSWGFLFHLLGKSVYVLESPCWPLPLVIWHYLFTKWFFLLVLLPELKSILVDICCQVALVVICLEFILISVCYVPLCFDLTLAWYGVSFLAFHFQPLGGVADVLYCYFALIGLFVLKL